MYNNTPLQLNLPASFQQWYLRQAIANNLVNSLGSSSANRTSNFQTNKTSSRLNQAPKVIKPSVIHKLLEANSGPVKTSEELVKSSNSAFNQYIKQKATEIQTPDFIRARRPNLKLYDIKIPQTHQKLNEDSKIETLGYINSGSTLVSHNEAKNGEKKEGSIVNKDNCGEDNFDMSENETSRSRSSTSKANFRLRTDVVNKTILRAFKKYYTKRFKSFYDFSKMRKGEINNEEFLCKADEFVTKHLGESKFGDMHIFVASIVDTKQKYSNANPRYSKLKDQINSLLYSFNKQKVEALLSYPEFSHLLLHFLDQPNVTHQIVKNKEDAETMRVYKKQIESIKERCKNHLHVASP